MTRMPILQGRRWRMLLVITMVGVMNMPSLSSAEEEPASEPLYCVLAGESINSKDKTKPTPTLIPQEWINDDYCDCPLTGADEPNTSACSGAALGLWSGITSNMNAGPANEDGHLNPIPHFTCPQQSSIHLSPSKLNDGICDCCDGADEALTTTNCPDRCEEVLAAERAAQKQLQENFNIGYAKRHISLKEFREKQIVTKQEVQDIETSQLPPLKQSLEDHEKEMLDDAQEAKEERQHFLNILAILPDSSLSFASSLTEDELVQLIESMCHLEGESEEAYKEHKSNRDISRKYDVELDCISLLQILEEELDITCDMISNDMANCVKGGDENDLKKNKKKNRRDKFHHSESKLRADSYDVNASSLSPLRAAFYTHAQEILKRIHELYQDLEEDNNDKKEKDGGRRPASDYDDDYQDPHDPDNGAYDDDYRDHHHAEDYYGGDSHMDDHEEDEEAYEEAPRRRLTTVKPPRAPAREKERHNEDGDAASNTGTGDDTSSASAPPTLDQDGEEPQGDVKPFVDPMALNLVKDQLSGRLQSLQRGARYAKHARAVMEAVVELLEDEKDATTATANDGKDRSLKITLGKFALSVMERARTDDADVVEAVYTIVTPSVGADILKALIEEDGICGDDPGLPLCPPLPPVERKSHFDPTKMALVPPEVLVEILEKRCQARFEGIEVYTAGTCAASEQVNIPADAPNGFHGYFEILLRAPNTLLARELAPLNYQSEDDKQQQEVKLKRLQGEVSKMETDLKSKKDEIGLGDNEEDGDGNITNKYGPDGILYSWKDTCLSVQAGKYTYEICPFGKATQKEGRGGGTSLGTYQNMQFDQTSKQYYLLFDKGQKCWNGPQRSAKVFLTCGAADELVSAEEPETCAYHIHGSSPLMCDAHYAKRHNLSVPTS